MLSWCFGRFSTMLEWREQEHEFNFSLALNDDVTLNVLCECALYKLFLCLNM